MRDVLGCALLGMAWFLALCVLQPSDSRDGYGLSFMAGSALAFGLGIEFLLL